MAHAKAAAAVIGGKEGSQIDAKNKPQWDKLVAASVDDQADAFLRAFVTEFAGGKFEDVLDIASQFKKFCKPPVNDLDEAAAHLFMEKRGETVTAAALRQALKEIDVDNNHRVSYLEYALYKWKKTVAVFFIELAKPKAGGEALQKAIAEYRAVLAVREAREAKMKDLEAKAALGGVKGNQAKMELAQMKSEDGTGLNRNEITAGAKKRAAEKNAVDPFAEEQKRLAAAKAAKDAEDAKKHAEQRAKLAAKTALWGGQAAAPAAAAPAAAAPSASAGAKK